MKISKDKAHLRNEESPENKTLYEPAVQPYTECDTHHHNKYRAEYEHSLLNLFIGKMWCRGDFQCSGNMKRLKYLFNKTLRPSIMGEEQVKAVIIPTVGLDPIENKITALIMLIINIMPQAQNTFKLTSLPLMIK